MKLIDKIKSLKKANQERLHDIVPQSEIDRVDKLIDSRMKKSYLFLTVVAGLTLYIFGLWTHSINEYKAQFPQQSVDLMRLIWFWSFALSFCIINVFAALKSIAADSKFQQPLVEINKPDVYASNLLHISISETAKASIIALISLFVIIPAFDDKIFFLDYAVGYKLIMCLLALCGFTNLFNIHKQSIPGILVTRGLLWALLSIFMLLTAFNMCGIEPPEITNSAQLFDHFDFWDILFIVMLAILFVATILVIKVQHKQHVQIKELKQEIARLNEVNCD